MTSLPLFVLNMLLCSALLDDPYISRISTDHCLNESMFDNPHYISNRKDPTVWSTYLNTSDSNTSDIHGPLTMDELNFYSENGYLLLPNFVSSSQTEIYKERVIKLVDHIENNDNNSYYVVSEPEYSTEIRHIFEIHKDVFFDLSTNSLLLSIAKQILNSSVYVYQSRINLKSAFIGSGFKWHSDFEAWRSEDGMVKPRAFSMMLLLQDTWEWNGGLMVIPGSHKYFAHTLNKDDNYISNKSWKSTLEKFTNYGIPNEKQLEYMFNHSSTQNGIEYVGVGSHYGQKGSVVLFDANLMHGSQNNISPKSRNIVFICYNSIHNTLQKPLVGNGRSNSLAERDINWIQPIDQCQKRNNKFKIV